MDWNRLWSESGRVAWRIWEIFSSGPAQRAYVVIIAGAVLVLAHRRAMTLKGDLEKQIKQSLVDIKFPGPKPTSRSGIAKRKRRLYRMIVEKVLGSWGMLAQMIFLGIVLPTLALFFGTLYYNWFYGGAPSLVDVATAQPVSNPTSIQLALFTLDQLLKGGLSDLMEVLKIQVATVSNNSAAYPFAVFLFGFRSYLDVFVILGFASLGRITINTYKARQKRLELAQFEPSPAPA